MPIPKETIAALRSERYKLTPQRKAVLRALNASTTHMTPSEVHERVRKSNPRFSLVTIYRTLNILADLGLVCEIRTGGNSKSYVFGNPEVHGHLICNQCGKVLDFIDYDIGDLEKEICSESGYVVADHRLDLYGICPDCSGK